MIPFTGKNQDPGKPSVGCTTTQPMMGGVYFEVKTSRRSLRISDIRVRPLSDLTDVRIRSRRATSNLYLPASTEKSPCENIVRKQPCRKPRKKISPETNPPGILILDLVSQNSEKEMPIV